MKESKKLDPDILIQSGGKSESRLHQIAFELLSSVSEEILDVGCGQLDFLERLALADKKSLTACDGFEYVKPKHSQIKFVHANLNEKLPFADNSFQAVSAIEVIEHLENPRHFFRELVRVLKPGGHLILSTPNNESLTSLTSLLLKGQFSSFAGASYPAHITAILVMDMFRIANEVGLNEAKIIWSQSGRIPGLNFHWQSLSQKIFCGKYFSDNYFISAIKSN